LWATAVNGSPVVPVTEEGANLIPLPQRADPNSVLTLDLQLAARSATGRKVQLIAPIVDAPVMLAEWRLQPDAGQRLEFLRGSLTPVGGVPDVSGFAGLMRMITGDEAGRVWTLFLIALSCAISVVVLWKWSARTGTTRFSRRNSAGLILGTGGLV